MRRLSHSSKRRRSMDLMLLSVILLFSLSNSALAVSESGKPLAFIQRSAATIAHDAYNESSGGSTGTECSTRRPIEQQITPTTTTPILAAAVSTRSKVDPRREITVEKSIQVPFSAQVAFDVFSDLPRQAEFSPWLRKVEYVNEPPEDRAGKNLGETKWYMGFRGLSFSWKAICTKLDRPSTIEWESTSGMKNYGQVVFAPLEGDTTNVTLTMTFVAPRLVARLFRGQNNAMGNFVRNKMISATLQNFGDIVTKELE